MALPYEWASVLPVTSFRMGRVEDIRNRLGVTVDGPGALCQMISDGRLPPILVRRTNRTPRHPAYAMSTDLLWQLICDRYPNMVPDSEQMGWTFPAIRWRNMLGDYMLTPAAEGVHSFARTTKDNPRDIDWSVAIAPRLWLEEGMRRLRADNAVPNIASPVRTRGERASGGY